MRTLRRRKRGELTPLEIQAQMGGGKTPTDMEQNAGMGKIIRFYANIKPREIVDDLTIEELKAAGFGPYRYRGLKDPLTGKFATVEGPRYYVHSSVPTANSIHSCESKDYEHPLVSYEVGFGWEAKWGAVRFSLRNEKELRAFMKQFNYYAPIISQ
ncbi:hypothetical protein [Spirosoma areae]